MVKLKFLFLSINVKFALMASIYILFYTDNEIIFLMKVANICSTYGVLNCDDNVFLVTVVSTFVM